MLKNSIPHAVRVIARSGLLVVAATLPPVFAEVATTSDAAFCVRPIAVVTPDVSDMERKLNSQEPLPSTPNYFEQSKGAGYPLAWHHHAIERPDGLKVDHRLFWSFSNNYELVGPRDFFGALGPVTVDRFGRSFLLGSRYEKTGTGKVFYRQDLFQQVDGGAIVEANTDLRQQIHEPRLLAWSDVLDGLIISSIKWRNHQTAKEQKIGRIGDEVTFLLKGETAAPLPSINHAIDVVADLPHLGAAGLLGGRSLTIVNPRLEVTEVAHLNPGDDYGGFEALFETRDKGWLYVVGDQYDNAVYLDQANGQWKATRIVRIVEEANSSFDTFFRWLLDATRVQRQRDGLSKVVSAGKCRRFSTAVKRMFFCGSSASTGNVQYELRAGEMVPIADGAAGLTTFLGDANSLGLALFLGADHSLYGYDGERVHRIASVDFKFALVQDISRLRRTFLSSPNGLFEVRARGDDFELVKLATENVAALTAHIFAAPEGEAVLVFAASGIYLLKGDRLELIWSPSRADGSIDNYGGTPPTYVAGWDGILFTSHVRDAVHFFLLKSCSESATDLHTR